MSTVWSSFQSLIVEFRAFYRHLFVQDNPVYLHYNSEIRNMIYNGIFRVMNNITVILVSHILVWYLLSFNIVCIFQMLLLKSIVSQSILIWCVQGLYSGHQIRNLEPSPLHHEGNWETKSFVNYMPSNLQDYLYSWICIKFSMP